MMLTQIRGDASLLTKVRVIAGNAVTAPHTGEGATDSDQRRGSSTRSAILCAPCALERKRQLSKMKKNQTSRRPLLRAAHHKTITNERVEYYTSKVVVVSSPFSGADMQNKINAALGAV
jgi:hypothetical protein